MFLLDSLLVGGLRFVLDKVAAAVETELNDESVLRDQLLEAQMRLELGELSEVEFADVERDILDRLREIKTRRQGEALDPTQYKVTGVEATFGGDDE
jgi:hypothetical protein